MESQSTTPSFSGYLVTAAILMVIGWGGLFAVVQFTTPAGGTRWLFFLMLLLAITGTMLPLVAFLNRRFPSNPPASNLVIVRQAMWFGVYLSTLAWLQIGRVLSSTLTLLLLVGLVIIEWLLRLRERSQWKP